MKKKTSTFSAYSDVTKIVINANGGDYDIVTSPDDKLTISSPKHSNLSLTCSGEMLTIKRGNSLFSKFFKQQAITISVPEYLVPEITFNGKRANVNISGGIFARLEFFAEHGKVALSDCAAESVEIGGGDCMFSAQNLTAKGGISGSISSGEILLENCFAKFAQCRNKGGNVCAVNLNCVDSLFEAENGNVYASLLGEEKDFNLSVTTKGGISNHDSDEDNCRPNTLKAFANGGNITIDFIKKEGADQLEENAPSSKEGN